MTATKFANGKNPFTGVSENHVKIVDVATLKIVNDEFRTDKSRTAGKYDAVFSKMKLGQAVTCLPQDVPRVSQAMRKWSQAHKKTIQVRAIKVYDDGMGRVWMLKP